MIPRCYFCGRRIGPRIAWTMVMGPGGFYITVGACSDCAAKNKVEE